MAAEICTLAHQHAPAPQRRLSVLLSRVSSDDAHSVARYAEGVFTYATKDQVVESLKRLAMWNHYAILLARAIYGRDGEWWLRDTYICLILENARVFRLLNNAMGLEELSIAALAARNALEMKVWILYANADEKNARRLYDDQMVDAREMMSELSGAVRNQRQ